MNCLVPYLTLEKVVREIQEKEKKIEERYKCRLDFLDSLIDRIIELKKKSTIWYYQLLLLADQIQKIWNIVEEKLKSEKQVMDIYRNRYQNCMN
ncbi:MAG: hypothetical protein MRERC_5c035 [Mycoplasmataceae bacterium RC_NB112A]|nr:MAG: hypothetical protein MRERC_5c035 [Mycoplasmataceae bacterium RC_NB112A]